VVKFWKPEKGWGAISSPDLPEGKDAWAHITSVEPFAGELATGQKVEFAYRAAKQDSFEFVAEWVHPVP
jgi:CspA family cold shock protein